MQFGLRDGGSAELIDHSLSELLATFSAEQTALVVVSAPDRRQLLYGRLATPLAEAAARNRVNRDRAAEFIKLHKDPPDNVLMVQRGTAQAKNYVQHGWRDHIEQ